MLGTIGDNMRNMGIIAILVGVGGIFISIAFSSKYHPALNLIGNIHRMEIVLDEGRKTKIRGEAKEIKNSFDKDKYIKEVSKAFKSLREKKVKDFSREIKKTKDLEERLKLRLQESYFKEALKASKAIEKKKVKDLNEYFQEKFKDYKEKYVKYEVKYVIKGRVAIPTKYPLSLSVLFILLGTSIVLLSKKRK